MDCRRFRKQFSDYADRNLDSGESDAARDHLAACAACRRFERAYRAGVAALRSIPEVEPTRDLGARIVNRVRRAPARPTGVSPNVLAGLVLAVALVGVALVGTPNGGNRFPGPRTTAAGPAGAFADDLRPTDLVTFRVAYDDVAPAMAPFTAVHAADTYAGVRVRFDIPAVWSGR